jgi:DNA-binding CsgD family transcriptional regulator
MPSTLIDRDQERAAVRAALGGLGEGPRGLVIEGEAGIGKTSVWRAAVEDARADGCRVLSCVADQAEARLPFVGLGDMLAEIAQELLPALPPPQREALEVVLLLRASASGRMPDPNAAGVALRSLLVAAAAAAPVLLAVDDAQWLDPETARALAFAARRLEGLRVGVLATVRAPLAAPEPLGLERALGDDRFTRLRLGPLGLETLHALLDDRLGHPYARPALLRIAEASGGNPLFALEIARALGPDPVLEPGDPLPVPDSLRELVDARVAGLAPDARAAMEAAAALSQPTAALVERAASPAGLIAAEQAGLLEVERGRVAFAHPLHASAVYTTAASGSRRALHRRLAELVADPQEHVRHLALAADGPDEAVAAALEDGAALARSRGAWATAGELLEQARALTPPGQGDSAWRRGVNAAEHHVRAGGRGRARALLERIVADVPAGPWRAEALRLLAEIHYNDEGFAGAGPLLEEALQHVDDPRRAVAIELGLSYVRSNHLGDLGRAEPHAARAVELAEQADDRVGLSGALAARAMVGFLRGRGVDWETLERARALDDGDPWLPLHLRAEGLAALLAMWIGRFGQAREELAALRLAAVESGDESDLAYYLSWLAWLETQSGDFAAAAACADDAVLQAVLAGSEFNRSWALVHRAIVGAHRGDLQAATADADAAAEICGRFDAAFPLLWVAAARGLVELSRGDMAATWAAVAQPIEAFERGELDEPAGLQFLPCGLEALIALGDLDRAERLLDRVERKVRELDRATAAPVYARCRALLLAERGEVGRALDALAAALGMHDRVELPFERARALVVQGGLRRRARQKRLARESLEQALALFEAAGARLWAQRTRDEIAALGRRPRKPGELTPAERRVAELAASGLSNKEIANTLFVSVHTVEVHLSKTYAKLGIRSRSQLPGRLH